MDTHHTIQNILHTVYWGNSTAAQSGSASQRPIAWIPNYQLSSSLWLVTMLFDVVMSFWFAVDCSTFAQDGFLPVGYSQVDHILYRTWTIISLNRMSTHLNVFVFSRNNSSQWILSICSIWQNRTETFYLTCNSTTAIHCHLTQSLGIRSVRLRVVFAWNPPVEGALYLPQLLLR